MRQLLALCGCAALFAWAPLEAQMTTEVKPFLHIPADVSPEFQAFLRMQTDPALKPRFPDPSDLENWKKFQAGAEQAELAISAPVVERLAPIVTELSLGGVPVLDVRPKGWTETKKVVVYTHGGAHVFYSAKSQLYRGAIFAADTGHRVVIVDFTNAPQAKFNQMLDQAIAVVQALMKDGRAPSDILIYGDSSGGGSAAALVLKMRDTGIGMPAAAVLVSPWCDVTHTGDTWFTLARADANFTWEQNGMYAASAYAAPEDQKNPYASPAYGDFSKGFPPTLIQGGTKEVLLSDFVRLYQALDVAGVPVKLDIYEGMPHNFATRLPEAPESKAARKKIADFTRKYLGDAPRSGR
jgi:acetyl esterase/lipase